MNNINPNFILDEIHFSGNVEKMCDDLMLKYNSETSKTKSYISDICAFIKLWTDKNDFITCLTSGSTGVPKNISIEKKRMVVSAMMTGKHFNLGEKSKTLICLPINYIAGKMMLVRAMVLGWDIKILTPCSSPLEYFESDVDFVALVPMQLYGSLDYLSKAKKILVGGGDISLAFLNKLKTKMPDTQIFQSYAMTETITHVGMRGVFPHFEEQYTAMDGVNFSISNENTLKIHAPHLCNSDIETTDMVELRDEKHFIWLGRRDNVINSGGIKIHPESIEKTLSEVLEGRFFIDSIPDETLGSRQVLFVEGRKEDFSFLDDFLKEKFDGVHRPKNIFFVEKFELTHTGKIDKKKTIDLYCE